MQADMDGRTRGWVLPLAGGLAAGLLAGLFGIGGGILLVPVLVLLLHRSQHVAHASSLVAIVVPAVGGAARFAVDGAVAWCAAAVVAAGALVGVQLGAWLLPRVSAGRLRWIFAALLAVMTVRLLVLGDGGTAGGTGIPDLTTTSAVPHLVLGLVTGAASALLGIGGGAIIVPSLVILFGYGQHPAEGTSLAIIVPTAGMGALTHARRGYTEWGVGLRLGLGGLVGALAGAQLALNLPADLLSRAFGALLAVVTVLLLRRQVVDGEQQPPATGADLEQPPPATRADLEQPPPATGADLAQPPPATGADLAQPPPATRADVEQDPRASAGDLEVRPLMPELTGAFLRFFDEEAHPPGHRWEHCYCHFDRFAGPAETFDPADRDGNREAMSRLVEHGLVRGWLAFADGRPVGWCHATSRIELPHLKVPAPSPGPGRRVAVIACLTVAPEWRRRGVATRLVDTAVEAFRHQGFHAVEAYPTPDASPEDAYRGPPEMYERAGFEVVTALGRHVVVRRPL
ncbi:MAG TPA: TSUP family transporter [Nitriliruptorales bacterium]|nr:TSUP family transporter [Nitriliruptorales bacterium]